MIQGTGRGETKNSHCLMPVWYCDSCDNMMVCSELADFEEWLAELFVEYITQYRPNAPKDVWN